MRTIAHIVNPVKVTQSTDLHFAQPITFETMRRAKDFARDTVDVTLYACQFPDERDLIPEGFQPTRDLLRTIDDVADFRIPRKLPFLGDILDRIYEASQANYFVYTNSDISLMPHFYTAVNDLINQGYDGFVINRRTIPDRYRKVEEIPLMYAETGSPHEGHDCFVFRRDVYPSFYLARACLGVPWIGRVLLWNVFFHATRFHEFQQKHLTFHIGNACVPLKKEYLDYHEFGKAEAHKVEAELRQRPSFTESNNPFQRYPLNFQLYDELPSWTRRFKSRARKAFHSVRNSVS